MTLEEYIAAHKLDNARYKVIGAVKKWGNWVVVQASIPPAPQHYCLQYAGQGRYFHTLEDLNAYTMRKWGECFTQI